MTLIDRRDLIEEAREWIGTPYHYRAAVKGAGCDCVGLINALRAWALGETPLEMPAYSRDFANSAANETLLAAGYQNLVPIALGTERPGDVVAFRWRDRMAVMHVGLLVENDRVIHARRVTGVCEVSILPWRDHGRLAAAFSFPGVTSW